MKNQSCCKKCLYVERTRWSRVPCLSCSCHLPAPEKGCLCINFYCPIHSSEKPEEKEDKYKCLDGDCICVAHSKPPEKEKECVCSETSSRNCFLHQNPQPLALDELVRDLTQVVPRPKSEVKRRILDLLSSKEAEVLERVGKMIDEMMRQKHMPGQGYNHALEDLKLKLQGK
jgi:hypothetical protein